MEQRILPSNNFTKEQVARGIEARWNKFHIVKYVIIFLVSLTAFIILLFLPNFKLKFFCYFAFAVGVILSLVFLVQHVVGYLQIIKCVGRLPVCRVTLTDPQRKLFYRRGQGTYYFTLTVNTGNGSFEANTRPMFVRGWVAPIKLSKYKNRDVYVYFDEKKCKVYVIDLVENL